MNFTLGVGDKKVKRYIKLRQDMVPKCMRTFMVQTYANVMTCWPVKTGRSRWGFNCSIGTPNMTVPPEGQYGLDLERANTTFTAKAVTGKDTLYITNNVWYSALLNNGWSKQMSARGLELSFDNAFKKLQIYVSTHGYDKD